MLTVTPCSATRSRRKTDTSSRPFESSPKALPSLKTGTTPPSQLASLSSYSNTAFSPHLNAGSQTVPKSLLHFGLRMRAMMFGWQIRGAINTAGSIRLWIQIQHQGSFGNLALSKWGSMTYLAN